VALGRWLAELIVSVICRRVAVASAALSVVTVMTGVLAGP
jgi:hypothetical protein